MNHILISKKIYPSSMILGAGILLFRTFRLMFFEDGLVTLAVWVNVLTAIEMIIDMACFLFSIKWLCISETYKSFSLRLGATAAIIHAFRVIIFVIGRVGPWKDFDLKPEYRGFVGIDIFWVYFAGILSVLGIAGVIIIWKMGKIT